MIKRYLIADRSIERADTLFFATSSYQVILAHLLAADPQTCPGVNILVLKRRMGDTAYALYEALCADPAIPFARVILLDRPDRYKRRQRALSDRRRLPALRRLLRAARPARLVIFNEDPLDQYLARQVKATNGQVFAVEDGAIAYAATQRRITRAEGLKDKLLFGPKTRRVGIEGSSPYIDAFYAAFPQHVRAGLRHKPLRDLPGMDSAVFDKLSWIKDYLRRLGLPVDHVYCDGLFVLARSNNFRALADYHARMRAALAHPWTLHGDYAISYHPNEKRHDSLGAESQGLTLIDNAIPAELIYLLARERLQFVIGDFGTSLLSARWLLPGTRAISLLKYLGFSDPPFERTLEAIGVELPSELIHLY